MASTGTHTAPEIPNRPPPTDWRAPDVIAIVRYSDVRAAIDWLASAFGFQPHTIHEMDGTVQHAELRWGSGMVMLGARRPDDTSADTLGRCEGIYVVVEDVDAHCRRARAVGATIVSEPADQDYGSRDYQAADPEGHLWSFGTYRPGPASGTSGLIATRNTRIHPSQTGSP